MKHKHNWRVTSIANETYGYTGIAALEQQVAYLLCNDCATVKKVDVLPTPKPKVKGK